MKPSESPDGDPVLDRFSFPFVCLFGLMLVAAGAGLYHLAGPGVIAWWDAQTVWGKEPDARKPWAPSSCRDIAGTIRLGEVAKKSGARKAKWMAQVAEWDGGGTVEGQEAVREVSDAWDKGEAAGSFYDRCLMAFVLHMKRQQEGERGL